MQELTELLNSSQGRAFLAENGIFINPTEFKEQLALPANPKLANSLPQGGQKLICSGQQLYVDYRNSVLSKILMLQELEDDAELSTFFLWLDTDRSGSDNLITKFAWPHFKKKGPISIAPVRSQEVELRFVELDHERLIDAIDRLESYLRQSSKRKQEIKEKYEPLRAIFTSQRASTLSEFNLELSNFLLKEVLQFVPYPVILSECLNNGLLSSEINAFLNQLEEAIRVFNQSVLELTEQGINPQVNPLDENYLPFFYSCERDGTRIRLYHHIAGDDHFAIGRCKCKREYSFHLGTKSLSISELPSKRWSLDVCMPLFMNEFVSGFVGGKSSAIYLISINHVLHKVLGKKAVPILVPATLTAQGNSVPQVDSLLYRYLMN